MRSLKVQLIGAIAATLGLGLIALLVMAGSQMSTMTMQAFLHEKETAALAVASTIPQFVDDGRDGNALAVIQQQLSSSASRLDMGLTVLGINGDLIASTHDHSLPVSGAPEIAEALAGRMGYEVRDGTLYLAVPIVHDGRVVIGLLWTDASLAPVDAELNGRWLALIAATLVTLGVACGIGWWLSVRIIRPLIGIQRTAEQMARGQLDVRATVSTSTLELASLGKSFNHMAQEVEGILTRQRDFVANASHELRAPLAAIKLRAEALATGNVDGPRAQHYASEINDETTRLGQLVSDLLHLSRIDNQSFTPPAEPLNVKDELMASVRTVRPHAATHHQEVDTAIQPDIPDVFIHPNDLRLMVDNLLDNAVKYTPENGHVSLSAGWQSKTLTIEICDTGEGIPPADLPRVTERFFRVDRAHTRSAPGTGLGLALVLATAQQYGGDLTLESSGVPGQGTRACLSLRPEASTNS